MSGKSTVYDYKEALLTPAALLNGIVLKLGYLQTTQYYWLLLFSVPLLLFLVWGRRTAAHTAPARKPVQIDKDLLKDFNYNVPN